MAPTYIAKGRKTVVLSKLIPGLYKFRCSVENMHVTPSQESSAYVEPAMG